MDSVQGNKTLHTEPILSSENIDIVKKSKRVLADKQHEALKAGQEKRWKECLKHLRIKQRRIKLTKSLYKENHHLKMLHRFLHLIPAKAMFHQSQSKSRKRACR